MTRRPWGT